MSDAPPFTPTLLGRDAKLPASPEEAVLDTPPNPHPDSLYMARFTCPEFTSLCPVTGQPDFAHFVIDIVPKAKLIESKALKLFLQSFRNHAAFHEDCTVAIGKRLRAAATPLWSRVAAFWYPRGGTPIAVLGLWGPPPEGVWLPEPDVPGYRGRG
ncbi:MAG: preQ(1) synthase [Pseudomonadota bacterium]